MAKNRYSFVVNGSTLAIGKATGQAKARTLLKEAVTKLTSKGWLIDTQKADHVILVAPSGSVKSVSLVA